VGGALLERGIGPLADELAEPLAVLRREHGGMSMDPNRYEVSEPELLRGLSLS
jgi:hypothetical protein